MTTHETSTAIIQTLTAFNNAVRTKNAAEAFSIFDNNADIILAGSSKEELHRGAEAVKIFLESFLSNPFSVSWDMRNTSVDQNGGTAWIFADGDVTITYETGKTDSMPYRIAVVMIKRDTTWKWRLFNGSIPGE